MKFKIVFIAMLITVSTLITSCLFPKEYLSKGEIFKVVKENHELLDKVPAEIKSLTNPPYSFSITKKEPIENQLSPYNDKSDPNYKEIEGLYLLIINEDYSNWFSSINNDVLAQVLDISGVMEIRNLFSDERFYINFDCGGEGFASATIYYGFYFTEDNLPIGWEGEDVDLAKKGKGWTWTEAEGSDNIYYTERILDHWFYYKMSY